MESTLKMDQDALIAQLQKAQGSEVVKLQDGRELVVYQGQVISESTRNVRFDLACLSVESLESVAQLAVGLSEGANKGFIVQVVNPSRLTVVDVTEPLKHQTVISAKPLLPLISVISEFVPLETALIELRNAFIQGPMVDQLTEELSSVKVTDLTELNDDGRSMSVGIKTRITSGRNSEQATVFNIELTPIRTFAGVEAVPSIFTMRWKRSGTTVLVRLVEQMPHEWRLKQMTAVQAHLNELLPDLLVLV